MSLENFVHLGIVGDNWAFKYLVDFSKAVMIMLKSILFLSPDLKLLAFRALKTSNLEVFWILLPYSQIGGFYGLKCLQVGGINPKHIFVRVPNFKSEMSGQL